MERIFLSPDNDYGELNTGNTTLSFASIQLAKSNLKEGFLESDLKNKVFGFEIGFTTNDVDKTIEKAVKKGAVLIELPKTKPWGQTVAYLRDINGFLIEICTPMN